MRVCCVALEVSLCTTLRSLTGVHVGGAGDCEPSDGDPLHRWMARDVAPWSFVACDESPSHVLVFGSHPELTLGVYDLLAMLGGFTDPRVVPRH